VTELRDAVRAADAAGDVPALITALEARAAALVEAGDYERAACILGGTDRLRGDGAGADRTRALLEEALGTVRLAELTADGRRLDRTEVVALALQSG
jgi:hypothetical protein